MAKFEIDTKSVVAWQASAKMEAIHTLSGSPFAIPTGKGTEIEFTVIDTDGSILKAMQEAFEKESKVKTAQSNSALTKSYKKTLTSS